MRLRYYCAVSVVAASILLTAVGCGKLPPDSNCAHYLRLSNAYVHVSNGQGSTTTFTVQSDVAWQLAVASTASNWVLLDKSSGNGNETVTVTTTQHNNTGGYRFAEVIASAVNTPSLLPVHLTVVQYDSTFKGK